MLAMAGAVASIFADAQFFGFGFPESRAIIESPILISILCDLTGAVLMATPEQPNDFSQPRRRRLIRSVLIVTMSGPLIQCFDIWTGRHAGELRVGAVICLHLLGAGGLIWELALLESLAMRVPNREMASHLGFVRFAIGLPFGIFYVTVVLIMMPTRIFPEMADAFALVFGCCGILNTLILCIAAMMYLRTIVLFRRIIRDKIACAENFWTSSNN